MTFAAAIGARVRALRVEREMSATELARRSGMPRQSVPRLEAGRHEPTLETVLRLAAALDVPPTAILAVLDEVEGWA